MNYEASSKEPTARDLNPKAWDDFWDGPDRPTEYDYYVDIEGAGRQLPSHIRWSGEPLGAVAIRNYAEL